ncbi:preprotein translocase subunit SecE [Aestuariirhabdus litorea]|uniref:Protein translocase subunit SecE n=1 Tax=Aestuariirhabdus litorea TaxID=2528527 RepID=A0A3P3VIK4_9GAMM|nr:preprotein translocase subunit SecE [Aestuariirhabdus litorea]RRJ82187.1 preprotein translocase subunit SecE [Aestuariirhabdus litorea]RWW91816.1 preprotein translocase subunit SecE [Endozoicomonadaceae bacterium GTF-13]
MAAKLETENVSRFDGLKWLVVVAIVGLGAYGNQHYAEESLLYRVLALLVMAALAMFVAVQTAKGRAAFTLLKESRTEVRRVVWPTRQETTQTTLIVVAAVLVVGLLLWGLDSLLSWVINLLIG